MSRISDMLRDQDFDLDKLKSFPLPDIKIDNPSLLKELIDFENGRKSKSNLIYGVDPAADHASDALAWAIDKNGVAAIEPKPKGLIFADVQSMVEELKKNNVPYKSPFDFAPNIETGIDQMLQKVLGDCLHREISTAELKRSVRIYSKDGVMHVFYNDVQIGHLTMSNNLTVHSHEMTVTWHPPIYDEDQF